MYQRTRNAIIACVIAGTSAACSPPDTEQEQMLLTRASAALDAGDIDAAIVDIKTALQQNPDSAAARMLMGDTYMVQREAEMAAAEFLQAYETDGGINIAGVQRCAGAGEQHLLLLRIRR